MKSKRYIIASFLLVALRAVACGPGPFVLPDDCDLYRLMPYYAELREPDDGRVAANCRAWMAAVPGVSEEAVRQAVYDFSLLDWQRVLRGDDRGNAFCRKLIFTCDVDAIRLLLWSKYYEQWSEAMRSPWYYGAGFDDGGLDIDRIAKLAANYRGRYADRYLLLAMKCLYRSGRSEECVALWKEAAKVMQGSHLGDQAEGYYAACLNRLGRKKEAVEVYARLGDAASLQFLEEDKAGVFEQVMRYRPNSPFFPVALQRVLFVVENYSVDEHFACYDLDQKQLQRLLKLAVDAAGDPRVENQAMWRYVAACLLDHEGRQSEALKMLDGAETQDEFLATSIRILGIYLHSRLDAIDDRYERRLFADLQWMDSLMLREWEALDSVERYRLAHIWGFGYNFEIFRTLYANDALRRIVLSSGGLADRFIQAGRTVRALQLANMADNRFLQLTDNPAIRVVRTGNGTLYSGYVVEEDDPQTYNGWSFSVYDTDTTHMKYCYPQEELFNYHDFSNSLFVRIDRMGADVLKDYWDNIETRRDGMDRWLNERGYTDSNYWCDIVGTHLLREVRFAEAEQWLSKVSPAYQLRLNTHDYMIYNPFGFEKEMLKHFTMPFTGKVYVIGAANYKLRFVRQMVRLERQAREGASADDRADALLTLSIALRNAFSERCWPLVAYGYNSYSGFEDDTKNYPFERWDGSQCLSPFEDQFCLASDLASFAVAPCAVRAEQCAAEWRKQAFATYQDRDRIAQAFLRTCQFAYLMHHYADTPTGQEVARHCDEWKDYRR